MGKEFKIQFNEGGNPESLPNFGDVSVGPRNDAIYAYGTYTKNQIREIILELVKQLQDEISFDVSEAIHAYTYVYNNMDETVQIEYM